ncbi:acyltransferase domain-containing protein [Hymenobacter aquaticus]|uniref:Acyltransferase domain-containing protein n=1 Tax=Hymenobacter aquaticus TaxID=1867101 RepID=A0A4Z0PW37_9BACT|nr:type I polyketide synthase [Hymenobacter aquaticus]TGE21486.1 acyltransferase domain-containing protein [Hymenobacter aquaticus]
METKSNYTGLEVAVIGMACRMPDANTPEKFWQNLQGGKESVRFYSDEELAQLGMSPEKISNPNYVKAAVNVDDKDCFDANFFDYRPGEAMIMDPQTRVFHECLWEAFEDAGYVPNDLADTVSLHVSGADSTNWRVYTRFLNEREKLVDGFSASLLNNVNFLPTLVSYKFNLKGPALFLFSACSSSLIAVHQACRSLLTGESKMAVAGGVKIKTSAAPGYVYQSGMIYSPDGHCKAFDANANGTIGGEGAGVVLLKKLKDALADGDNIYAIIKGSAINNDGNRKVGYTAPSVQGQVECIKTAHKLAKVDPGTLTYIEAHGTGTKLGDPIEIEALTRAFDNPKKQYCAIGSLKTNFGHLDSAAGIAGFMKTVLAIKNRQIPASLNFKQHNPEIDFENSPFFVNQQLRPWNEPVVRAGVSSFGIGGTNAHVVLEEAPVAPAPTVALAKHHLFTFSAKTAWSLDKYLDAFRAHLQDKPSEAVADVAYTLQSRRKAFKYRATVNAQSLLELRDKLTAKTGICKGNVQTIDPKLVFAFPGTGVQYRNMGLDLYNQYPSFRARVDEGLNYLLELTGEDYRSALFAPDDAPEAALNRINATTVAMPLIFVLEHALASLLLEWGLKPSYLIGHSLGEYAAACVSGVFGYKDGLRLVLKRAQLIASMPTGAMLSIYAKEEQVLPFVNNEDICLAAVNSPDQCVVAGPVEAIEQLRLVLHSMNINSVRLNTEVGFHSSLMDPILADFKKVVDAVALQAPQIPFVSNLHGGFATAEEVTQSSYWVNHLRQTVRFAQGAETLLAQADVLFVEVGPRRVLTDFILSQAEAREQAITAVSTLRKPNLPVNDEQFLKDALAVLWVNGVTVAWQNEHPQQKARIVSLPTYQFEKKRFTVRINSDELYNRPSANTADKRGRFQYPFWRAKYLAEAAAAGPATYLLFSQGDNLFQHLESNLLAAGNEVLDVRPGEQYTVTNRNTITINPTVNEHEERIYQRILSSKADTLKIVYNWSFIDGQADATFVLNLVNNLVNSPLNLRKVQITVVSQERGAAASAFTASAADVVQAIAAEFPQVFIRSIAVDANNEAAEVATAQKIAQELAATATDAQVAYRQGKRWVLSQDELTLGAVPRNLLKPQGTYVLAGALNSISIVLAEYLVREFDARVILPRFEPANKAGMAPHVVASLEKLLLEGRLYFHELNASNPADLAAQAQRVQEQYGPINGVIYVDELFNEPGLHQAAAGRNLRAQLSAKGNSLLAHMALFNDEALDFGWVASCGSALMDSLEPQLDACAAGKWVAVNFSRQSLEKIMEAENLALLKQGLVMVFENTVGLTQVSEVTYTSPTAAAAPTFSADEPEDLYQSEEPRVESYSSTFDRSLLNTPLTPAESDTEKEMLAIWEDFFGFTNIGIDDFFFALGGDSLKTMIMLNKMHQAFSVEITLEEFFRDATIKELSRRIDNLHWAKKQVVEVQKGGTSFII